MRWRFAVGLIRDHEERPKNNLVLEPVSPSYWAPCGRGQGKGHENSEVVFGRT